MRIRYLKQEKSRHGKPRLYVRLPGQKMIRLPVNSIDDPRFGPAYAAALNGDRVRAEPKSPLSGSKPIHGSLRELCVRYFGFLSEETQLTEGTKYTRRKHLEDICREPLKSGRILGDIPLRLFEQDHVMLVMDRKRAKPEASNGRRKALLAMFNWAIPRKLAKENPAALVKRLKSKNPDGYATWGTEHVERFKETHPLGTRAYLAMAMLLFTGQRRSDVIRFGRQHIKDGAFHFVQQKGERTLRTKMRIEILPALQEALDLVPKEQLTFLVTHQGRPFTAAGFSNWFRDVCNEAGLKGYSAHGLRKALQTIGSESGLSDQELMALAGHESNRMTLLYTKKRDRDALASSAMAKLSAARFGNRIGAPDVQVQESEPNRGGTSSEIKGR
jgi:integrase